MKIINGETRGRWYGENDLKWNNVTEIIMCYWG